MTTLETPQLIRASSTPKEAMSTAAPTPLGQKTDDTQGMSAEGPQLPRMPKDAATPKAASTSGDTNSTVGHMKPDAHRASADGGPTSATDHVCSDAQKRGVGGGPNSRQAKAESIPLHRTPAGSNPLVGQVLPDTHDRGADEGSSFPADQRRSGTQSRPVGGESNSGQQATAGTTTRKTSLADPTLALAADVLDDLEIVRIANENRLRQLTRSVEDSDGEQRGFGLTEAHPAVARLAAIVELLKKAEADATKNLEKTMRVHPLGPWIKAQHGIGEKQGARLLAAIGDPYWNTLYDRPRTVSELWAYCGYGDARTQVRRRGQMSKWSDTARKRAWLVAKSIVKSGGPYREVYDAAKARYADAIHSDPCVRCGPAGKPAAAGSALSKGHIDARGLRAISKAVLKELWRESKRLHEEGDAS